MREKQIRYSQTNVDLSEFPAREVKALIALTQLSSVRAASKECKVSESQLYRYLSRADFKAQLRNLRKANFEESSIILQRVSRRAALTMVEILQDERAPHFVRLSAARLILDAAHNSYELETLYAELDELKELVKAKNAPTPPLRLIS